eukprot:Skav209936  [mRNA]  locus=scaffold102:229307:235593:+ [translate_table: standard]
MQVFKSLRLRTPWAAGSFCVRAWQKPGFGVRQSHSKPSEVPCSKRQRLLQRPSDLFRSQTGRSPKDKGLYFLAAPTGPADFSDSERNPRFSHWRSKLKKVERRNQLMPLLRQAVDKKQVDASVFGAAMQKCGHCRWWDALLQVHQVQRRSGIPLFAIQRRILLTAIGSCLKDQSITSEHLNERKQVGLSLGKQIWKEMPWPPKDYNMTLGAVLSLCAAVGPEALGWANDILESPMSQGFRQNVFVYTPLLSLYEQAGDHRKVGELLKEMVAENHPPNVVTLGHLINDVGANLKRADQLWDELVNAFDVAPNVICYTAHAKVSILAGQPSSTIIILETMKQEGLGTDNTNAAVVYLQALLIVCHSDPSASNLAKLSNYLEEAETFICGLWDHNWAVSAAPKEPLNGDYFDHVDLLKPGEADRRLLQPLYASVGEVIHSVDPAAILMYEPAPFPDTLPAYLPLAGGVRPVGFTAGPGTNRTQALSYHIYSCGFATDKCSRSHDRKGDLPSPECPVCDEMASSAVDTLLQMVHG